jgi:guanyl-specific ribonuclease Sa
LPQKRRIIWGPTNPFGDPRLKRLDWLVHDIRSGRLPAGVRGGKVFENREGVLPRKPAGHYREYDVAPPPRSGRGTLRLVLGRDGEIYVTGDHYDSFLRVLNVPEQPGVRT